MQNPEYLKALNRSDVSSWLLHLTRPRWEKDGRVVSSFDVLTEIVNSRVLRASLRSEITSREQLGATCFYDVPPSAWTQLVETNPSGRTGHGVLVHKTALWAMGGRPAIYTEQSTPELWPAAERYRIIHTDLARNPPIDWTHEREWRLRGNLDLSAWSGTVWWWLCVDTIECARECFRRWSGEFQVFVLQAGRPLARAELVAS